MIYNKTNAELLKEFDKRVVGHTQAKKTLISLVNRSKTAHYHKYSGDKVLADIETMNCLLVGGSGTGKTFLVDVLQELVDFPLVRIDATQLGPAGSTAPLSGHKILNQIVEQAQDLADDEDNINYHSVYGTIDQTIVFIDEVDKISTAYELNRGNWNRQTQATLLTLLENSEIFKNVSFVLAGAFVGLEPTKEDIINIGFNCEEETTEVKQITAKDIINYGLMPELVGRLSNITVLDVLEYKDMKKILNKTILPQKIKELSRFMEVPKGFITNKQKDDLINRALESGQGARSLKREVNDLFADLEFNFEVVSDIKLLPKECK